MLPYGAEEPLDYRMSAAIFELFICRLLSSAMLHTWRPSLNFAIRYTQDELSLSLGLSVQHCQYLGDRACYALMTSLIGPVLSLIPFFLVF